MYVLKAIIYIIQPGSHKKSNALSFNHPNKVIIVLDYISRI